MHYPFFLYSRKIELFSLFDSLTGDPYLADLSSTSSLLRDIDMRDQRGFQKLLDLKMAENHSWGLAAYLENRSILLSDCPQMVEEERYFHLGLDIIVPLGTPLYAPLDGTVVESGYESGEGNYGSFVLLRHQSPFFETVYSFYGHLCRSSLPEEGSVFKAGHPFAEIGDFHENGNWFYHTHLQILTEKALEQGYISKGYCNKRDLAGMDQLCPSPNPFFKVF